MSRARAAIADSPWTPLAAKTALGIALFFGLALVGSGAALGLLPNGRSATAISAAPAASSAPFADAGAPMIEDAGVAPLDASIAESDAGAVTGDGKVVLNLATEEDLRRLPGIGPTRAHAIVELRTRLGKLKRPEDLLRVKGIGRRLLGRLRPLVLVDRPSA